MSIRAGDRVWAMDATGERHPRRAITEVIDGSDFPVIWVCREEDYAESYRHSYPPARGDFDAPGSPWPAEDVTLRALTQPTLSAPSASDSEDGGGI